jgi:hypothetical protein
LILYLLREFRGHFIFRCSAQSTFRAVRTFIESGKDQDIIWITPSDKFLKKTPKRERKDLKAIKLRVIRLVSPDGTLSVLLTSLCDKKEFPSHELSSLYFKRWEVESYYRDEKVILEVEEFHGKSSNSIRQELFAAMIMSVISRVLMIMSQTLASDQREPRFKNAVMTLASEAAVLAAEDPTRAVMVFQDILEEIRRVIYYRPKGPRASQPRVTKRSHNKWLDAKVRKVANA